MNIIKLQNMLRGVPDDALIGYVQNPQGEVPSYLALSELQRRKDTRAKYQAEQAPESSVAEDLEKETMPDQGGLAMLAGQPQMQMEDQGVAGLPVPDDMYQDQNFAGGGIVAFENGGGVTYDDGSVGYPIGGYVAPAVMATGRFAAKYGGKGLKYLKDKALGIPKVTAPTMNLPTGSVTPVLEAGTRGLLKTPGSYIDAAVIGGVLYGIDEYGNKEQITEEEASKIAMQKSDTAQLPKSFTGIGETTQFGPSTSAINQMSPPPTAPTAKSSGPDLGGLYQPLSDYSKDYAALYQDPAGMAEKEMARYRGLIGEDKMRPQLEEKLKKMEERSAKAEEQAPYMALIRAGLGMAAGKSPFALQNLAEGAAMGLEDYNKAKDKFEASRDKQFDLQARLAQAKRAEDVAAATFGANSEQFIKAQNQSNKLAELSYKTNREAANQKNKIDAFDAVQKGKYYDASAEESRAKAGYYSEKGPGGEITEKQLFDKYMASGGELIHGTFEEFKRKNLPKAIPLDINNIVNKYTLPK
jgi:hypothetical protein